MNRPSSARLSALLCLGALAALAGCGGGTDGPRPTVSLAVPSGPTLAGLDVTLQFTGSCTPEGGHAYSEAWTFEGGAPATSTDHAPQVTFSTAGAHVVSYRCRDQVTGTWSATLTHTVVVTEGPASSRWQTGRPATPVFDPPAIRVVDANGAGIAGVTVRFAVTSGGGAVAPDVVTTDATGLATTTWTLGATSDVQQQLHATLDGRSTAYDFVAHPLPGTGYTVDLRFLSKTTDAQWAAFLGAAKRISTIVTGKLSPLTFSSGWGDCMGVPFQGTVSDLMVLVQTVPIDGAYGILARSGPCGLRSKGAYAKLPALGIMTFDSADLERSTTLNVVVLHEMLHVVGFGTVWDRLGRIAGAGTSNPTFNGPQAIAALHALAGGEAYQAVPVEGCQPPRNDSSCGAGTRDAHWSENVFGNELMTGWITGATNPLSAVTVRSLADLGYVVDPSQAEPYALPSAQGALSAKAAPAGEALFLGNDTLEVPPIVVPEP